MVRPKLEPKSPKLPQTRVILPITNPNTTTTTTIYNLSGYIIRLLS